MLAASTGLGQERPLGSGAELRIAFTVDLEPDWGTPEGPCRVLDEVLPDLLAWLDAQRIRGTFFTVGELARRFPDAVRRIAERHEIASHGHSHRRLDRMDRGAAAREVAESKQVLESVAGTEVRGFRAPFLKRPGGLADALAGAGYAYDSSGGACAPSLANAVLPKGAGPFRYDTGDAWLPISTMRDGLTPFCLTALRVGYPVSLLDFPRRPRLLFLHLHELSDLPVPAEAGGAVRRMLLRRGRGAVALRALSKTVEWYRQHGGEWMSCEEYIAQSTEEGTTTG